MRIHGIDHPDDISSCPRDGGMSAIDTEMRGESTRLQSWMSRVLMNLERIRPVPNGGCLHSSAGDQRRSHRTTQPGVSIGHAVLAR